MTTVGYGDVVPRTRMSRGVVLCACFFGSFFVSLIVVTITRYSTLSAQELAAYHLIEKRRIKRKTQQIAAKLIVAGARFSITRGVGQKLELMQLAR